MDFNIQRRSVFCLHHHDRRCSIKHWAWCRFSNEQSTPHWPSRPRFIIQYYHGRPPVKRVPPRLVYYHALLGSTKQLRL